MRHDLDLEVQGMAGGNRRRRPGRLLALGLVVIASLFAAPGAHAADRIYWSNFDGNSISYANLNGNGGGGTVDTTGATVAGPMGLTIDPAHDLIYWANWDYGTGTTISYANLEGGGGGDLDIQGATVAGPHGLAIDPSIGPAGRLYWPNAADNSIGYADLDGAGGGVGGDLTITNATVDEPRGMTIDRAGGRLYWSNFSAGTGTTISYAGLGPEGGDGDLLQVGSTGEGPEGTAIDPVTGRIYWSDYGAWTQLAYANVDGSNVQSFDPGTATVLGAHGVAIDPVARRLFWANYGDNSISSASLAGGDGQDLDTSGATINGPNLPSLLEAPVGTGDPQVSGGSTTGVTLSCSPGAWAGDLLQSLLYRAPHELDYQWRLDGADLTRRHGERDHRERRRRIPLPRHGPKRSRCDEPNERGTWSLEPRRPALELFQLRPAEAKPPHGDGEARSRGTGPRAPDDVLSKVEAGQRGRDGCRNRATGDRAAQTDEEGSGPRRQGDREVGRHLHSDRRQLQHRARAGRDRRAGEPLILAVGRIHPGVRDIFATR